LIFISYSRADGREFAVRLSEALRHGSPPEEVFIDDDLELGAQWDWELEHAIANSEALLYVMTRDSVGTRSACLLEVARARELKKPIVPLRLHENATTPFLLSTRQVLAVDGDFDDAVAKVRAHLRWLRSPEGEIRTLEDDLADLNREFGRLTKPEQQRGLLDRRQYLQRRIDERKRNLQNPEDADRRAEERIQHAIEQDLRAQLPADGGRRTSSFLSALPPVPRSFQDRHSELARLEEYLRNDVVRLVTVTGPAGIGKTALVSRWLAAASQGSTTKAPSSALDDVVYLSPNSIRPLTVSALLDDLSKLLPNAVAAGLHPLLQDPQMSSRKKVETLLPTLASSRIVVVLDDARKLLAPDSARLEYPDLEQALQTLLRLPNHGVKVIFISRSEVPPGLLAEPGQQRALTLDKLPRDSAIDMLRSLDIDDLAGLRSAPEELLTTAWERTGGIPKALEALYAVLATDPHTSLAELLTAKAGLPPRLLEVVVGEAFSRLDVDERRVVEALAVYGRPVRPEAVDHLLLPYAGGLDSRPLLDRLAGMHLVSRDGSRYYLPPIDREYVFGRILKGRRSDRYQTNPAPLTQVALLHRAADFLRRAGAPDEEVWRLEDQELELTESGLLAGYVADTVAGDDLLGIREEVNALCSVLAARDVEPPLSVGLFGDWGSGKSFFMEQMRRRIRQLAKRSRTASRSAYCSEIRQITFNAWHYADANLWASLVTHIFDCLAAPEPEDPDEADTYAKLQADKERAKLLVKVTELRQKRERMASLTDQLTTQQERFKQTKVRSLLSSLPSQVAQELQDLGRLQQHREDAKVQDLTVRDIEQVASEYRGIWNKLKEVWRELVALRRTGWIIALAAIMVVLVAGGLGWLARSPSTLVQTSVLASWVGWLAACLTVLGRPIKVTLEVARRVGNVARRLEEQQRNARKPIEDALREAEASIDSLDKDINQLQEQVADLSWSHQLYRFTAERSTSSDYREHLGVVAMIRQDFEHLSTLLRRSRIEEAHGGLRKIDRIILYIDDLDRCPAQRVVQVLEAVHLLLAVDLFVVVVGVDSRWLLRSLEHRYAELLPSPDDQQTLSSDDAADWAATPMNYLEKIFQIPYTLRPMESGGYGRLLDALMRDRRPTSSPEAQIVGPAEQPTEGAIVGPPAAPVQPAEEPPGDVRQPVLPRQPRPPDQREEIDLAPILLQVTEPELEFMKLVGPLISTPRAAKRFSNVYRLLRASMDPADIDRYVGADDRDGEYQVVLLLLALLVGFPQQAAVILDELRTASGITNWWEFLQDLQSRIGSTASHRSAQLKVSPMEATKWNRLFSSIDELRGKQPAIPDNLELFRSWTLQVARFSFQTGHLMAAHQQHSTSTGPLRTPDLAPDGGPSDDRARERIT
jgi:hypothetical protein